MYEGGPGLESSRNNNATDHAITFNRHDLAGDATLDVLEAWYDVVVSDQYNKHPGIYMYFFFHFVLYFRFVCNHKYYYTFVLYILFFMDPPDTSFCDYLLILT
jgi:hypothetical protein